MEGLAELQFRIALLPSISRGAHLDGPDLHARRLVALWKVDDGDVPLAQAFRLLDETAVAGAILRTAVAGEYGDARHWILPDLEALLPELRDLAWGALLDGKLAVAAIKGVRGKRYRVVLPAELPRLRPDWSLSRLCHGERDEFIEVRVRRPRAGTIKKSWRKRPTKDELKPAMQAVAAAYPPGAQPAFKDVWAALKTRWSDLPREQAEQAITDYAPQLRGRRGYRSKT